MSMLSCRVFKKIFLSHPPAAARRDAPCPKQGRSEREGETYFFRYVEPLSDARTKLAVFFNTLLAFSLNYLRCVATMPQFRSYSAR